MIYFVVGLLCFIAGSAFGFHARGYLLLKMWERISLNVSEKYRD